MTTPPPTDQTIIGTLHTDDGQIRPATVADLDWIIEEINRGQRAATARAVSMGIFRPRTTSAPRRTREHRSPSTTRTISRRARTSATSTADPSSSRVRLSADALGALRIETTRLGFRLALLGTGGAR